ncbi:MAG TPA: AMP-binding protein [Candidatus Nitrosopolaris sp.]|nr:AMP-binding protein [Candidatus Nitrosopolaris sp.]
MDTLAELVRARVHRLEPALIDDATGVIVTAGELADRVAARGQRLVDAGVRSGDRVAVLLPNSVACAETLLATAAVGAAVVPINLRWTAPEVAWLLADARPRVLVADTERLAALGPLGEVPPVLSPELTQPSGRSPTLPAPRPDDPALILYTSGTTGRPKGAVLTHRNLLWNAGRIAEWLALGPGDRFLMVMPLFHANAIVLGLITPLLAGASTVVADRFRREHFWGSVERHRPTTAGTVPTMLAMLLAEPAPPPPARASLRFLLTGSAPVPADLLLAFEERCGVPVIEGYGLTECTCRATFNPIDGRRRPGSCGLPLAPLRIVDPDGRDVPTGAVGEIIIQGPHVMQGYFHAPEATAQALRGGWLRSGDLGRLDDDGFVHIAGRANDLVIRGGENIYPREVEETLLGHPAIAEAAVVGAPDPLYGEVVWAFVVTHPEQPIDEVTLSRWCATRLADFKRPAEFVFVPELPKNPTGKVLKAPLRALAGKRP